MDALNGVIRDAYRPYSSTIKEPINKTNPTFDFSYLEPEAIEVANHRPLSKSNIPRSLLALSIFLKSYYKKHCMVLIDEYDAPYDTAYQNGYYEKARPIMSQLLSSLLKVLLPSHTRYSIFYFYCIG
jgi:hypothetical protein